MVLIFTGAENAAEANLPDIVAYDRSHSEPLQSAAAKHFLITHQPPLSILDKTGFVDKFWPLVYVQ